MSAFGDFTVTRASTKNVLGSNGLYQSVANNVPAFEFNTDGSYRGLLVEPGATNSIRNNSMTGAVAGTPGTLPTNWSTGLGGLTQQVVGTGTELGVTYIDIRFSGTSTSTLGRVRTETTTGIVASNGQTWTASNFIKIVAQPNPPVSWRLGMFENTVAGAEVTSGFQTIVPTTSLVRYSQTRTLSGGGTVERVQPTIDFILVNATAYDFTVRIGWPQMETGSVATSPIVTTAGTASRVADVVLLTGASSLIGQTGGGTLYVEVDWRASGATQILLELSNNSFTNRMLVFRDNTSSELRMFGRSNGIDQTNQGASAVGLTGIQKIAFRYAQNSAALYRNGSSISTDATFDISALVTLTDVNIGADSAEAVQANMWIRAVALFPTPLTNAQLTSLTTL